MEEGIESMSLNPDTVVETWLHLAKASRTGSPPAAAMTGWRFARLDELTAREVHDILQARSAVFVVEQACVFQDVDGADPGSWHLFARRGDALAAYCRLASRRALKFREPSIGRVDHHAGGARHRDGPRP